MSTSRQRAPSTGDVPEDDVRVTDLARRRTGARVPSSPVRAARAGPDVLSALTDRETEIVALVAEGLTNDQIAARLVLSPLTVKTHVSRAMM